MLPISWWERPFQDHFSSRKVVCFSSASKKIPKLSCTLCEVVHSSDHRLSSATSTCTAHPHGPNGLPVLSWSWSWSLFKCKSSCYAKLQRQYFVGMACASISSLASIQSNWISRFLKFCSLKKGLKNKRWINSLRKRQKRGRYSSYPGLKSHLCVVFQDFDIRLLNHLTKFL